MIQKTVINMTTEEKFSKRDTEKLRGYFLNLHKENTLYHNHEKDSTSIYRMPLIQYKVVKNQLCIVGLSEASRIIIEEFLKLKTLNIDGKEIKIQSAQLQYFEEDMYIDTQLHEYKFRSMWLPITQRNYNEYKNGSLNLNKVLQNNILTNFKGFNIQAEDRIMVSGKFRENTVELKDKKMIGFYGEFVSNVILPELIGIGQHRSIGYGDVIKLD
jgi:hypothetical protein